MKALEVAGKLDDEVIPASSDPQKHPKKDELAEPGRDLTAARAFWLAVYF